MTTKNVKTTEQLNEVLSALQVVYQNFRTMHWLVKGPDFYQLHKLYEDYYTETADVVDEVAERILMLGGIPETQWQNYLDNSQINALKQVPKGKESIKLAINYFEHLLVLYRKTLAFSSENEDEATNSLFSDLISSTEKKLWMLTSTLA